MRARAAAWWAGGLGSGLLPADQAEQRIRDADFQGGVRLRPFESVGALSRLKNGARIRTQSSNGLFRISDIATLDGSIKGTSSFARVVRRISIIVCRAVLLVNSRRPLAVSVCRQHNIAVKTTIRQSRFNHPRSAGMPSSAPTGPPDSLLHLLRRRLAQQHEGRAGSSRANRSLQRALLQW